MKLILALILTTQMGCAFLVTAAGSFIGNLGARIITEEKKKPDHPEDEQASPSSVAPSKIIPNTRNPSQWQKKATNTSRSTL